MTRSWGFISSRRDSPSTSRGTSRRRDWTSTLSSCTSRISISIENKSSNSQTSFWPCRSAAMHSRQNSGHANFDYYERFTVRDSSLSACTEAVAAADAGHLRLAFDYAAEAALMDLQDVEHKRARRAACGLTRRAPGSPSSSVSAACGTTTKLGIRAAAPRRADAPRILAFSFVVSAFTST